MTRREAIPASIPAVVKGDALDVSGLPSYGFAHRSLMWWGNAGMMAIEGVAFGFMIVIYFYLRSLAMTWPDGGSPPDLLYGNSTSRSSSSARCPTTWRKKPRRISISAECGSGSTSARSSWPRCARCAG